MTLYINTTTKDKVIIGIQNGGDFVVKKEFDAPYRQSETLLPEIENMLRENNISLKDLKAIEVENQGGTFSSVRIGILTANALAYAIDISVNGKCPKSLDSVSPEYSGLPNIKVK